MGNTQKTIFWTLFTTLLVELVIIATLGGIFYYNYKTFATSNSGVSIKTIIKNIDEIKEVQMKIEQSSSGNQIQYYFGILGDLTKTVQKNANNDYKETTVQYFRLDQENIKKAIIINELKEKNLLDTYTYHYLKSIHKTDFSFEGNNFLNFQILLGITPTETIEAYKNDWNQKFITFLQEANALINTGEYASLSSKLSQLEENLNDNNILENIRLPQDNMLNSISIQYVLNKLLKDEKYHPQIEKVAEIFQIDETLLVSAIGVEQIRYMTTARGYAKNMIVDNAYLTNFSQFSHGLGGIKVETARKIILDVKKSNPKIYDTYFKQDEEKDDAELIARLQDPFGGVLYAGALISTIQTRWESEGQSLKYQPGITITLYNMGNPNNKQPNPNPKLGGSLINIDGKQMYFGEIGYIVYYYLKYYVE